MEITGRLISMLETVHGTNSQGNPWKKRDFVIETDDQYPKKICFTAWKDAVDKLNGIGKNATVKVHFNAESKEHDGRWFTNLSMWKIEVVGSQATYAAPQATQVGDIVPDESDQLLF